MKTIIAAAAGLTLIVFGGAFAPADFSDPPDNQTIGVTRDGAPLADALGLQHTNAVDAPCRFPDGRTTKISTGIEADDAVTLCDGLRAAWGK